MQRLRKDLPNDIAEKVVFNVKDYLKGIDGLPKADVLKFLLEGNSSVVIRPSGTEPKLKVYLSVSSKNFEEAKEIEFSIANELNKLFC